MAVKYWFKAGNGSDNWSVAANWYLGPGGTGGTTTIPAVADTIILNAASGSGTLTIAAAAACQSLDMTGFTGTLAGTSTLTITNNGTIAMTAFKGGGTITYTGTLTFNGSNLSTLDIDQQGTIFQGPVTLSGSGQTYQYLNNSFTCIGVLTITGVQFQFSGSGAGSSISCFSLSSSGATSRGIYAAHLYLTGTGALASLATTTSFTWGVTDVHMTANTSLARSWSAGAFNSNTFPLYIEGNGTGSVTITPGLNFLNIIVASTGTGIFSVATGTVRNITFVSGTNMVWNNAVTQTVTFNENPNGGGATLPGLVAPVGTPAFVLTPALTFITTGDLDLNGNSLVTGALLCSGATGAFGGINILSSFISNVAVTNSGTVNPGNITVLANSTFGGVVTLSAGVMYIQANCTFNNTVAINNTAYMAVEGQFRTVLFNNTFTIAAGGNFFSNDLNGNGINNTVTFSQAVSIPSGAQFSFEDGTLNLPSVGTVLSVVAGSVTSFLRTNVFITDTVSGNNPAFAGGGKTFGNLTVTRGAPGGNLTITGSNTFNNFTFNGQTNNTIIFTAGTTTTVSNFFVTGNPGKNIALGSSTTGTYNLVKSTPGDVVCNYLSISHCIATGTGVIWYAGSSSVNNQAVAVAGSGWVFLDPPITTTSKFMALLGVG